MSSEVLGAFLCDDRGLELAGGYDLIFYEVMRRIFACLGSALRCHDRVGYLTSSFQSHIPEQVRLQVFMLIPRVPEHTHQHLFITIITRVIATFSSLHKSQPIRDTETLLRTGNQLHLSIPQRRRGQLKRDEVAGGTYSCLRKRPFHVKVSLLGGG
jgi:hypothetical protein